MWWHMPGAVLGALCLSRTAVYGELDEGVLQGFVGWLCIWDVLLVY